MRVLPTSVISGEGQAAESHGLLPGTLVSVTFLPGSDGQSVARQVSILAAPGTAFVFVGRVTSLDLHVGLLAMVDPRDQKSYELDFDPSAIRAGDNLHEGATVEVTAIFNGSRYTATAIKVEADLKP